jgi:hypothetical protein
LELLDPSLQKILYPPGPGPRYSPWWNLKSLYTALSQCGHRVQYIKKVVYQLLTKLDRLQILSLFVQFIISTNILSHVHCCPRDRSRLRCS